MEIHFVYANGFTYSLLYDLDSEDRLRSFIFRKMKKYRIKKVMVTCINMWRWCLITKERMESYCEGKNMKKNRSMMT